MRILIVSSRHHPGQGGTGACVGALVQGAVEHGWHVELMTRQSGHLPPATRVHIVETADERPQFAVRVPALRRIERIRPYRYGLWSLAVAERLLKTDLDVDVVLFADVQAEGYVATRSRAVREALPGVPFVIAAHGPMFVIEESAARDAGRFGRSIYHQWERTALALADGVVGLSSMLLDAAGPFETQSVTPPIIAEQGPSPRRSHAATIAMVGDVALHKGADVWARSLNRVFRQVKDVRAQLIGPDTSDGPDGSSMAAHVQSLIDPRFRDRFEWLGPLSHGATLEAIEAAALLVVPSRFDSFSCVAAERIVRGEPIVVSDRVGIGEWVDGLPTVPSGQAGALAEMQIRVLRESATWRRWAREQRRALLKACAPQRVLGALESFVDLVDARVPASNDGAGQPDAMEEVSAVLRGIEQEERRARRAETRRSATPAMADNFTGV